MEFISVISGDPSPYATWYKDGKELEEKGPVLEIKNVKKSDHQGEYTCVVKNDSRMHKFIATLTVGGRKRYNW